MPTKHTDSYESEDKDNVKHCHERIVMCCTEEEMSVDYPELLKATVFSILRCFLLVGFFTAAPILINSLVEKFL